MVTATPTPTWVIITSVPTPENVFTAQARAIATATAVQRYGTPTPLPPNWVTPIVVTNTPLPQNQATAVAIIALATANYLAYGEPTPTPPNVWTATPTPTWVIITSVPTPANPATAQARAIAAATAAFLYGTATPLPPNWVTPIVVTATPVPENAATAQAIAALATANVLLFGPPTPTPPNVWTATPTPLLDMNAVPNPTPTPEPTATPTPDPNIIPPDMIGRIGFISDRDGGQPWYYVMDADGSNVQRLSGPELYNAALVRDTLDPTGQYQAIVTLPRNPSNDPEVGKNYEISLVRLSDGYIWYIAGGERGADYAPAYCQADPRYIAYTSQQSGNDEIFVVDLLSSHGRNVPLQTTRLTQNDWPWDKHPSWSPDCRQIVFYSNRDGRNQIYVLDFLGMGFLGAHERNLSNNLYNDWDPVWFKPPPATP
jgi:catechol 2,3-dioxygenase-like lactoylglutathione lyase family enzyme